MEFNRSGPYLKRCNVGWNNQFRSRWPGHLDWFSQPAPNRGTKLTPNWLLSLTREYQFNRRPYSPLPGTFCLNLRFWFRNRLTANPSAYRHAKPPAGHPRQPAGKPRFCRIGGCTYSTTEGRNPTGAGRHISLGRRGWRALPVVKFLPVQHVWEALERL